MCYVNFSPAICSSVSWSAWNRSCKRPWSTCLLTASSTFTWLSLADAHLINYFLNVRANKGSAHLNDSVLIVRVSAENEAAETQIGEANFKFNVTLGKYEHEWRLNGPAKQHNSGSMSQWRINCRKASKQLPKTGTKCLPHSVADNLPSLSSILWSWIFFALNNLQYLFFETYLHSCSIVHCNVELFITDSEDNFSLVFCCITIQHPNPGISNESFRWNKSKYRNGQNSSIAPLAYCHKM